MLEDKDRIFKNLYNDASSSLDGAFERVIGVILKKFYRKKEMILLMK